MDDQFLAPLTVAVATKVGAQLAAASGDVLSMISGDVSRRALISHIRLVGRSRIRFVAGRLRVGGSWLIMSRHYVTNAPVLDRTVSRPVVVVDDLARLRGPSAGVVTLPITLNWTPRTRYDLASETAQRSLYQVVLREAHTEDEVETYLHAGLLRRLWGSLTLPRAVREFWEAQHPILAS